jgi:protein-S-isoprenylcysteine O-methyltransferase Ste14
MRNALLISAALVGFGVVHSLVAGNRLKDALKQQLGERLVEGWYRLAYNVFAAITIMPTLALMALLPDQVVYYTRPPWNLAMLGIQAFGTLGLLVSLLFTDVLRFTGVRQAYAYLTGGPLPLPPERFQDRGMYALVRHPLYLFSLIAIWPQPIMTLNVLTFNIGATLYFAIGSWIEERRLARLYGQVYRDYCRRVPWPLPCPRLDSGHE